MSGIAGIFKFDPRDRVAESELVRMIAELDRIGPDGGGQYFNENLGMVYRAFHTTQESHFERQPLHRNGVTLLWDGRLDNGEDIWSRVSRRFEGTPTDLDIVHAAYEEWGTGGFRELLGDWALALWDQRKRCLYLARDCFGVRTLFYALEEHQLTWCTALDPLVLSADRRLNVDNDYLVGCLYPPPPLGTTPYVEIKAVLPAHFLTFRYGGTQELTRYWALAPDNSIRHSSDQEYEEHFLKLFRESVSRRIRSDRPVLAELSGGVDSSSIVCMADSIRMLTPGHSIETLSYFDTDEPGGDERPYFTAIERQRGKTGQHISMTEFKLLTQDDALSPPPGTALIASPGHFAPSIEWANSIHRAQQVSNSRVILSGLGGDELLGGVQYEALDLLEHLLACDLLAFSKSMARWSIARRKPLISLLKSVGALATARKNMHAFLKRPPAFPWVLVRYPTRDDTLQSFSTWCATAPSHLFAESLRYSLASQLSCVSFPPAGLSEKRYPILDRALYSFLASIPRTQIIQPDRRRFLMRRALRGVVPDAVLYRKSKWFGGRSFSTGMRDQLDAMEKMFSSKWVSESVLFDMALIRERLTAVQHGLVPEARLLFVAAAIEQWLRRQISFGIIAPFSKQSETGADAGETLSDVFAAR